MRRCIAAGRIAPNTENGDLEARLPWTTENGVLRRREERLMFCHGRFVHCFCCLTGCKLLPVKKNATPAAHQQSTGTTPPGSKLNYTVICSSTLQ